ncbi:hypothetical protein WJX82_008119 [Trebouxia sp. C0006]
MGTGICCATWAWQPLYSRHTKLQDSQRMLLRGSCFHGLLPPLRNKQQASGDSTLCCCNQKGQPPSAGPDISLLRPELQRQWHHAKNQHLGNRRVTAGFDVASMEWLAECLMLPPSMLPPLPMDLAQNWRRYNSDDADLYMSDLNFDRPQLRMAMIAKLCKQAVL